MDRNPVQLFHQVKITVSRATLLSLQMTYCLIDLVSVSLAEFIEHSENRRFDNIKLNLCYFIALALLLLILAFLLRLLMFLLHFRLRWHFSLFNFILQVGKDSAVLLSVNLEELACRFLKLHLIIRISHRWIKDAQFFIQGKRHADIHHFCQVLKLVDFARSQNLSHTCVIRKRIKSQEASVHSRLLLVSACFLSFFEVCSHLLHTTTGIGRMKELVQHFLKITSLLYHNIHIQLDILLPLLCFSGCSFGCFSCLDCLFYFLNFIFTFSLSGFFGLKSFFCLCSLRSFVLFQLIRRFVGNFCCLLLLQPVCSYLAEIWAKFVIKCASNVFKGRLIHIDTDIFKTDLTRGHTT